MVVSRRSRAVPVSELLVASSLCLAIATVTSSWADPSVEGEESPFVAAPLTQGVFPHSDELPPELMASLIEPLRQETPEEIKFSSALVEGAGDNIQLVVEVSEGSYGDIDGLAQVVDNGNSITMMLDKGHGTGVVEAHNSANNYGLVNLSTMSLTLEEIEHGPMAGLESRAVFQSEAYRLFRLLLNKLENKKEYIVRDYILQADHSLIMLRANGDMELTLYRSHEDGTLENTGEVLMDNQLHYELRGGVDNEEMETLRRDIHQQLEMLKLEAKQSSVEILKLLMAGDKEQAETKIARVEEMKSEFSRLYGLIAPAGDFEFFVVQESLNFAPHNWVKITNGSGIEVAGQASALKVLGSLYDSTAEYRQTIYHWDDLEKVVSEGLQSINHYDDLKSTIGEDKLEYFTRKLVSLWAHVRGDDVKTVYPDAKRVEQSRLYPIFRAQGKTHHVVTALTTEKSLQEAIIASEGGTPPDRILMFESQINEVKSALGKAGWGAWLKSWYSKDAYADSQMARDAKTITRLLNGSSFEQVVSSNGMQGDLPVKITSRSGETGVLYVSESSSPELYIKAKAHLMDETPKILVQERNGRSSKHSYKKYEKITDDMAELIDSGRVKRAIKESQHELNKAIEERRNLVRPNGRLWGSVVAAGTGMATGYFLQRGVDMTSAYYNNGTLPWNATEKESEEQSNRATYTGALTALSSVVNYNVLPYVAKGQNLFENVTPQALQTTGIQNNFTTAAVAGGISSMVTRSVASGYQYWKGDISGRDMAMDVLDAAGRAVPSAIGGAVGHYLFPYAMPEIPLVSQMLPVNHIGSIAGTMVANAAYDTTLHYTAAGVRGVSDYFYGSSGNAVDKSYVRPVQETPESSDAEETVDEQDVVPVPL